MTTLLLSLIFGSIGMGMAMYGKKMARPPALVGGGLLMVLPYVLPGALVMSLGCGAVMAATWVLSRYRGGGRRDLGGQAAVRSPAAGQPGGGPD